ncbi:hypothetical protein VHEMI00369 [[Torrubiella] hemipterigena]|uniref:Uncharacterized protein n=1 Tax=[Torrubiella] hemipterigena TaxID=1531966 RepID=A0A0A1SQA8_9HYPO|nr:hypothetical protein VHEMI00369 [[Torrubiella] hemipterigena]
MAGRSAGSDLVNHIVGLILLRLITNKPIPRRKNPIESIYKLRDDLIPVEDLHIYGSSYQKLDFYTGKPERDGSQLLKLPSTDPTRSMASIWR